LNSVYRSYQAYPNVIDALDFYTDHPFVDSFDTRQRRTKDILNIFSKRISFWIWWLSTFRMPLHTNMLCKKLY